MVVWFFWDAESGKIDSTRYKHKDAVSGIVYNPSDQSFISIGDDSTVHISYWDGRQTREFKNRVHYGALALDGTRNLLLTGVSDTLAPIHIWSLVSMQTVDSLAPHQARVTALDVSPDGRFYLSGDAAGEARLWDAETHEMLERWFYENHHQISQLF